MLTHTDCLVQGSSTHGTGRTFFEPVASAKMLIDVVFSPPNIIAEALGGRVKGQRQNFLHIRVRTFENTYTDAHFHAHPMWGGGAEFIASRNVDFRVEPPRRSHRLTLTTLDAPHSQTRHIFAEPVLSL